MAAPMTSERLIERGAALGRWIAARGNVDRLAALDRRVRHGTRTDWPGRGEGPELRNGIPDLDLPPTGEPADGDAAELDLGFDPWGGP